MAESKLPFLRGATLALVTLFFFISDHKSAFAVPECDEATSTGKYWEYREFLIKAGDKRGLAKGKGKNKVNGKGVKEALEELMPKQANWNTLQHAEAIWNSRSTLAGFQGAEGLISQVWVEIARMATDKYGVDLADGEKISIDVWGRIDDNNVAPHPNEAAYRYDYSDGSGHLWATMCFEIRWEGTQGNEDPDKRIRYSIKTEVAECGFSVVHRGSVMGNDPIFVDSMLYEPQTWRNSNPAFKSRGNIKLMSKLEAKNSTIGDSKGYNCPPRPPDGYVTLGAAFFEKQIGEQPVRFEWEDLGDESGPNGHLFEPSPEACVDILFARKAPPPSMTSQSDWPNYCLGRCSDPPVINSGM